MSKSTTPPEAPGPISKNLDAALQDFYDNHQIDISRFLENSSEAKDRSPFLYRFVRLNPRYGSQETLQLLTKELDGTCPIRVTWLPDDDFYAIPSQFQLSSSPCFQSGRVYGMDVSSGAAVSVLLHSTHDDQTTHSHQTKESKLKGDAVRVLDLCCCPGLKLCAIADQVPSGSTVVGVDISEQRMALCRKIIQKYHIEATRGPTDSSPPNIKIQLYCQDGTTFGTAVDHHLIFDSRVALDEETNKGSRKRKNKSSRAREKKRLKQVAALEMFPKPSSTSREDAQSNEDPNSTIHNDESQPSPLHLFDYVLVDAECSTDGSLKHLNERLKESTATSLPNNQLLTDKNQLADLVNLQRRLLASGYRLLRPGGTLVYSTCSLSRDQNEEVVQWLLENHSDAQVIPVAFSLPENSSTTLVREGSLHGTIRFSPNLGRDADTLLGDGFFLAKIGKQSSKDDVQG